MNRYKFSEKDIQSVIAKISKDEDVPTPNWYKKLEKKGDLVVKDGKLFLGEKQIVPQEDIDKLLRKLFYSKESAIPWSRDSGSAAIAKKFIGISKRRFADFAQRQRVKIRTDNVPKTIVKKGRKLSKKGVIEMDLFHVSRKDLPTYITSTYKPTLKKNVQHYVLHMTDKLTSLSFLAYLGTNKSRKHTKPFLDKGIQFFKDRLGMDKSKMRFLRDAGGEFPPVGELSGHIVKLGPAVEARNSFAQRVLHRLLAAKRGNLAECVAQSQDIMNNTKSRNSKKTPNEAAVTPASEIAPLYNKNRTVGKPRPETKLKVGDFVRIVTKSKKIEMYKAYKATQFSKQKYKIVEVGKSRPFRYKLHKDTIETKNGKKRKVYVWKFRDEISNAEKPIDQKSEELLSKRTATGKVKAIPKPKAKKKSPPPPKKKAPSRRSGRGVKRVDYSGMM